MAALRTGLVLLLSFSLSTPALLAVPAGGTFLDDDGNPHEANIEAIASAGITMGCTPAGDRYCPGLAVRRGEMAALLGRALDLPAPSTDRFVDDNGSIFETDINRMAAAGITTGCMTDRYCPDDWVTREQMAAFLARAYRYTNQGGVDRFVDDDLSPFETDIEKLATEGITLGCAVNLFCPADPVLRDQMASFLARANDLAPIVPPPRCGVFPVDNVWNHRVDTLAVHGRSATYVASIGSAATIHADFGSGVWPEGSNSPIGIPFVKVEEGQPLVPVLFTAYGDESDPGPYPIPPGVPIEGGPDSDGDRHVLVVAGCKLYELYRAFPNPDGSWNADSSAVYDLASNALRPAGWTSADAAGLPIYPGLVRYDEVASGRISHAIRFTAPTTQRAYVWPARHFASSSTSADLPPMGQRFRLKSSYDVAGFSVEVQVILMAMKEYGIILADNGAPWYISGAPDPRWRNDALHELGRVPGSAFEAVDVSPLMIDADSGATSG